MSIFQKFRKDQQGPLADEPGPSTWHLKPLRGVGRADRVLAWQPPGGEASKSGKRFLVDHDARALLLVDFYCWVRPLGASRLLVWHQTKRAAVQSRAEVPTVHIHLFDLARLGPLVDAGRACQELDASSESVLWSGGHVACCTVAASKAAGLHHLDVPEPLNDAPELFVLVDAARPPDAPRIHLWIVRPGAGTLEVLPQDWFNTGSFDVGYQWITRVAREPVSGRLVGEGMRLRPFALDDSGTQVQEWLDVNPFGSGTRG
jgi:hypothetical protein